MGERLASSRLPWTLQVCVWCRASPHWGECGAVLMMIHLMMTLENIKYSQFMNNTGLNCIDAL